MLRKSTLFLPLLLFCYHQDIQSCTIIAVGKKASADGSVIVSQTDNGDDCRIRIIPSMDFPKGTKAPVFWG